MYLQFPLFAGHGVSKCDSRYHRVGADYISRLKTSLVWFICDGRGKMKFATLAFLYFAEFGKTLLIFCEEVFHGKNCLCFVLWVEQFVYLHASACVQTSISKQFIFFFQH